MYWILSSIACFELKTCMESCIACFGLRTCIGPCIAWFGSRTCCGSCIAYPNFEDKSYFDCFCRDSVHALGHASCLNRTVPRTALVILCLRVAQNQFLGFFVDCPRQALVAPFIISCGSPYNSHDNPTVPQNLCTDRYIYIH